MKKLYVAHGALFPEPDAIPDPVLVGVFETAEAALMAIDTVARDMMATYDKAGKAAAVGAIDTKDRRFVAIQGEGLIAAFKVTSTDTPTIH